MTVFIVIGIIVLIFVLLFSFSIRAEVRFLDGKLDFSVKYIFFTVYPVKKKSEKKDPAKNKNSNSAKNAKNANDNSEETQKSEEKEISEVKAETSVENVENKVDDETEKLEKEKKEKLFDKIRIKIEQAKILWKSSKKGLAKIFSHIHINNFMIDFTIGGEDACEAAVNYGKISAVTYNAISFIRIWFPISVKSVDICCDFDSKKSIYDFECSVRLGLGTAIAAILAILFGILKNKSELDSVGKNSTDSEKNEAALNVV